MAADSGCVLPLRAPARTTAAMSRSRSRSPTLSAFVMNYNEAATLEDVVRRTVQVCQRAAIDAEVVVIDDGSTDASTAVASALASELPSVRLVRHAQNLGLGGVYRTGFRIARGELVVFLPADGEIPPEPLPHFVERAAEADLVLGTLPEWDTTPTARLLSYAERLLLRALVGPFPPYQGILLFRRALLDDIPLVCRGRGWTVVMELVAKAYQAGYRVAWQPTPYVPRRAGASRVRNLRTIRSHLEQLLVLADAMEAWRAAHGREP